MVTLKYKSNYKIASQTRAEIIKWRTYLYMKTLYAYDYFSRHEQGTVFVNKNHFKDNIG